MTAFWGLWDAGADDGELPSPREVIQIFALASKLAAMEAAPERDGLGHGAAGPAEPPRARKPLRLDHVERALRQFREGPSC